MSNATEKEETTLTGGKYAQNKYYFLDEDYLLLCPQAKAPPQLEELLGKYRFKKIYTRSFLSDTEAKKSKAEPPAGTQKGASSGEAPLKYISHEFQKIKECKETFAKLTEDFASILDEIRRNLFTARGTIGEFTHKIAEIVKQGSNHILRLEHFSCEEGAGYISEQAIKTALLCSALAQKQKYPYYRLMELMTVGLLHNVGFIKMHPELYQENKLTDEERKLIAIHPYLGSKIVKELGFPTPIHDAILHCRENVDGSGYPQKARGSQIPAFAKIVSVCSAYAALVSNRPYKDQNVDGHAALKIIINESGKKYDQNAIQMLLSTISLFPVGTFVELESKHQGIVIEPHVTNIKTPLVRVISENFSPIQQIKVVTTHLEPNRISRTLSVEEKARLSPLLMPSSTKEE